MDRIVLRTWGRLDDRTIWGVKILTNNRRTAGGGGAQLHGGASAAQCSGGTNAAVASLIAELKSKQGLVFPPITRTLSKRR